MWQIHEPHLLQVIEFCSHLPHLGDWVKRKVEKSKQVFVKENSE
jgi:hypothetical protein